MAHLAWLITPALSGCGGEPRPAFLGDFETGSESDAADRDAGSTSPLIEDEPSELGAGSCGETTVELDIQRPNFYFVLDASESMLETMPSSGGVTRHLAARRAIADMLRAVGHRINYGAATFPESGGCSPGSEVFPVRQGDPLSESGDDGPVLDGLLFTLSKHSPLGATPVAQTIRDITPALAELEGDTSVFLLTDGAPNCDLEEPCTINACIPNIERIQLGDGRVCNDEFNCCEPGLAPHLCLDDDDAQDALQTLNAAGVETYVIGMPGSETYSQILDAMAEAGGTARAGETGYYPVQDAAQLALTLTDLGAQLSLSCEFDLGEPPQRPDLVYVATDGRPLEFGEDADWSFQSKSVVVLQGAACEDWKQGNTAKVQVFEGCPFTMK